MEILAFVFGIFGLVAYLQTSSLKRRIEKLELELAKTEGTPYHAERSAMIEATQSYIGQTAKLDLKEDHEDVDIMSYGNSKHGTNTILDADEDWLLVRIKSAKGEKDKLIRMESVQRISVLQESEQ
jgi:hypothetical protein